jgi:hypothetical protein
MTIKLFTLILTFILLACNETPKAKITSGANAPAGDTTHDDYSTILAEREKASFDRQPDNVGELLTTISFNVKTNNKKDFENGIIPWASIEKPENEIAQLIDRNKIVIPEDKLTIIIDYPLTNEYRFDLQSKNGFTREQLLKEISKNYYKLYDEEEKSATIKTIPVDKRTTMYNRNQTNGKYGIWGHDIADLVLSEILVYKATNGQIILSLSIES